MLNKHFLKNKYYTNVEYYKMMEDWHREHGGVAVEPIILEIINKTLKKIPEKSKILEMGCGEGSITLFLAQNYPSFVFIGTDISPVGIQMANMKKSNLANVNFLVDDIENSNLKNETFHFIISQSVLEHLLDYKKALSECYRLLCSGGYLLIRVSNGGRKSMGIVGFIKDFFSYLFKTNKIIFLKPTFELNGYNLEEKRIKHQTNFDLVEIPSDILLRDLKKIGFKIKYFTTYKEAIYLTENWKQAGKIKKFIYNLYIKINIFPFNHMGRTTIVLAQK